MEKGELAHHKNVTKNEEVNKLTIKFRLLVSKFY